MKKNTAQTNKKAKYIQDPAKHVRWSFFGKYLTDKATYSKDVFRTLPSISDAYIC